MFMIAFRIAVGLAFGCGLIMWVRMGENDAEGNGAI